MFSDYVSSQSALVSKAVKSLTIHIEKLPWVSSGAQNTRFEFLEDGKRSLLSATEDEWFSTRGDSYPLTTATELDIWHRLETFLLINTGPATCTYLSWVDTRDATEHLTMCKTAPSDPPKNYLSIVLRLRNFSVEHELRPSLMQFLYNLFW